MDTMFHHRVVFASSKDSGGTTSSLGIILYLYSQPSNLGNMDERYFRQSDLRKAWRARACRLANGGDLPSD